MYRIQEALVNYKSLSDARAQLPDLVDQPERTILTRNGQPVAVIMNILDFRSLERALSLAAKPAVLQRVLDAEREPLIGYIDAATSLDSLTARPAQAVPITKRPARRAVAQRKVK